MYVDSVEAVWVKYADGQVNTYPANAKLPNNCKLATLKEVAKYFEKVTGMKEKPEMFENPKYSGVL